MARPKVIFVTGNPYKLEQLRNLLGHGVDVESVKLDITEIQGTIEEIAKDKCRRAAQVVRNIQVIQCHDLKLRCSDSSTI